MDLSHVVHYYLSMYGSGTDQNVFFPELSKLSNADKSVYKENKRSVSRHQQEDYFVC